MIGISLNDINQMKTYNVSSATPEIDIIKNVPLEYIKVIAVPQNKVKFVRKLASDTAISVVPMDMNEKFYYIDDMGQINFNPEQIKELAKGRKQSGIQKIYEKVKERFLNRGKTNDEFSRNE